MNLKEIEIEHLLEESFKLRDKVANIGVTEALPFLDGAIETITTAFARRVAAPLLTASIENALSKSVKN